MDNNPPVIIAFGPTDPKEAAATAFKNGHVLTGNGYFKPSSNGVARTSSVATKMNGTRSPNTVKTVTAEQVHEFTVDTIRKELLEELNKDTKKPNYLMLVAFTYFFICVNEIFCQGLSGNVFYNRHPDGKA